MELVSAMQHGAIKHDAIRHGATQHDVVAIGECMLELARPGLPGTLGEGWRLGYAGDALNTAVYLRRQGLRVRFLTALGSDPFSAALRAAWEREGLDLSLVLEDPARQPGLYAIRTDERGERSFSYWRSDSAARQMCRLPGSDAAFAAAEGAALLYFTGITLSILPQADRPRLLALARAVRARGGTVAFDPNYRPRGWPSPADARSAIEAFAGSLGTVLPTLEDEQLLWGAPGSDTDAAAVIDRWRALGADEVVVKRGAGGALAWAAEAGDATRHVEALAVERVVDTTGAGDSFNAAYLAARLRGESPEAAARAGHALAARVIGHSGALLPAAMPEG